ncbi:MAG: acyltransferase [Elusimicrobiales bacterium]
MTVSFYGENELRAMGFKSLGTGVKLSRKASYYNTANISIGDYTRIDDFCVLSAGEGGIEIGRNVHIAVFCLLIGQGAIRLGEFSNLSSRVAVYSNNDDYSGEYMTNPTVGSKYTNVLSAPVSIGRHVIVGCGVIILPGVTIGEGASIGALSLVLKNCEPFKIYVGVPAKYLKDRSRELLEVEKQFLLDGN